jgi:alanyl-tRNA synthetase
MDSKELRSLFLNYFQEKGHKIVASSSLIPDDDTVLFTTAGMQQFAPYLSSQKNVLEKFQTRHLCSCQKCFRTDDIEEIGDDTHQTFFEMLGNWSIGQDQAGYFKEGAIKYALDFLVNKLGLVKENFTSLSLKEIPLSLKMKKQRKYGKDTELLTFMNLEKQITFGGLFPM